jgi:aquaporin-1
MQIQLTSNAHLLRVAGNPAFKLGSNEVSPWLGQGSAFLIETMGTFLLVWTVMMTAVHKKSIAGNIAPIAIGWSVLLAHLVLIPFTGCGINPARSAGPHIVSALAGEVVGYRGVWIFYVAPFVGSGAAALMTSLIFGLDEEDEEEGEAEPVEKKAEGFVEVAGDEAP